MYKRQVLGDVATLSRGICGTEFVPAGLRGSMEKTTAAILYGRELGLPPMTALGSIHVIDGRAGTSAESMRALILQAGHELEIREMTTSRCRPVNLGRLPSPSGKKPPGSGPERPSESILAGFRSGVR